MNEPSFSVKLNQREVKKIKKLSFELNSGFVPVFHTVLNDALDNWINGLAACKKDLSKCLNTCTSLQQKC